ncbi:hypothetical protein HQ560_20810 [bacterium]|nr:hypothetical protein [bacterium]
MPPVDFAERYRIWVGRFLMVCGGIGIVAGVVPLTVNVLRMAGYDFGYTSEDWAAHGVEAMGLSVPWGALSSSDGAFLGSLLLAAGIGWRKGRDWAPLVTFIYAIGGTMVCGLDLFIFIVAATPGRARSLMLVLESFALALAVTCLIAVCVYWRRRAEAEG